MSSTSSASKRPRLIFFHRHETKLATLLLVLGIGLAIAAPRFFSSVNLALCARSMGVLLILSVGMLNVILAGGIDVSAGAILAVVSVVLVRLGNHGLPASIVLPLGLLTGAGLGAVNAALIAELRIPPIVATLGTAGLFRGWLLLLEWTQGEWESSIPPWLNAIGSPRWGGLDASVPAAMLAVLATAWILHRTQIWLSAVSIRGFANRCCPYRNIPAATHLLRVRLAWLTNRHRRAFLCRTTRRCPRQRRKWLRTHRHSRRRSWRRGYFGRPRQLVRHIPRSLASLFAAASAGTSPRCDLLAKHRHRRNCTPRRNSQRRTSSSTKTCPSAESFRMTSPPSVSLGKYEMPNRHLQSEWRSCAYREICSPPSSCSWCYFSASTPATAAATFGRL